MNPPSIGIFLGFFVDSLDLYSITVVFENFVREKKTRGDVDRLVRSFLKKWLHSLHNSVVSYPALASPVTAIAAAFAALTCSSAGKATSTYDIIPLSMYNYRNSANYLSLAVVFGIIHNTIN